ELNCLVCDACSAVCPAGVHMDSLQVVLRSALQDGQPCSWRQRMLRKLVFGWLFMDMRRLRLVARLLWLYQRLGARWLVRSTGLLKLLGLHAAEALLPEVPARFVVPRGEVYAAARPASVPVAFFSGCVMSTALADVDRAT